MLGRCICKVTDLCRAFCILEMRYVLGNAGLAGADGGEWVQRSCTDGFEQPGKGHGRS